MKLIPDSIIRVSGNTALKVKANSPKILFVAGVAGVVTSTVLACRATLKVGDKLDEIERDVKDIKSVSSPNYTETERKKDLSAVYGRGAFEIGKLYAPSAVLGIASIGAITGSHVILSKRNAGLAAAYATLDRSFSEYRDRVAERFGQTAELEIEHNLKEIEDGEKEVDGVHVPTYSKIGPRSEYARLFGMGNPNWQDSADYNLLFLKFQQNYFNNRLASRGHVFLNEIYDALGLERSPAGAVTGWIYHTVDGDGYIDFGLFNGSNHPFTIGFEKEIWVDFNVDGTIFDKI